VGNDPLEFIFGDLVEGFSEAETRVLCALTYFTVPAKVEHITELAECAETNAARALRSLINRSLVVPSEELKTFTLVPLVAEFLRKKKPEVMTKTGDRLEKRANALVVENGYGQTDRFSILDAAWPTIAAALPRFIAGDNNRLQTVCDAINSFLDFTGRWDEWLALSNDAEARAISAHDFEHAGWEAYRAGWIHRLRGQSVQVLECAERAERYWLKAQTGPRERAVILHLRGVGQRLANDRSASDASLREAVELWRTLSPESVELAVALASLAGSEGLSGDVDAAERDYREALRINRLNNNRQGIASNLANLARLALDREDWAGAEVLGREALHLVQEVGRLELIGANSDYLAEALVRQGKKTEALPHARRAVDIFMRLGSPRLDSAQDTLAACES